MAEGHVQQVLEKEVTCPLCLDILQDPTELPCDHVTYILATEVNNNRILKICTERGAGDISTLLNLSRKGEFTTA